MTDPIQGDQLRGHLETMVLSVLEAGDAHGFEILKRLDQRGCGLLRLKEGTVYPVLYRLEKLGLVTARWEESTSNRRGPRRRIYKLNAKGKRHLAAGRESWQQIVSVVGTVMGGASA
jgi:DNA-binding PadR family transcriptional regulator